MKKKLTNEQQEMLELLPKGLPKMNQSAKLVLANIIFKYGTDYAGEHGLVYCTNEDMAKDTGLTNKTVIVAVRNLEILGLIKSNRGKRGWASEYILSDTIKEQINYTTVEDNENTRNEIMEEKCNKSEIEELIGVITENVVEKLSDKINNLIELKFNELYDRLNQSDNEVKELNKVYYTTDTETETETEIDIDKESDIDINTLNNIDNSIEQNDNKKIKQSNLSKNEYVNKVFEWLDNELDYLFKVKDKIVFNGMQEKIAQYIKQIDQSKFTDKQWNVVEKKFYRWERIEEAKKKYFNLQKGKGSDNVHCSELYETKEKNLTNLSSDSLIDSSNSNNAPKEFRAFTRDEAIEWVSNDVQQYDSYKEWETHLSDSLNRKYGNWLSVYVCSYADKYYRNYYEQTNCPQDEDCTLAPWETPIKQDKMFVNSQ